MNYPECPKNRKDCCFQDKGGSVTCMWSPIAYDCEGNAIGGGMNKRTQSICCTKCNKYWISSQTELEDAQNKPRSWSLF